MKSVVGDNAAVAAAVSALTEVEPQSVVNGLLEQVGDAKDAAVDAAEATKDAAAEAVNDKIGEGKAAVADKANEVKDAAQQKVEDTKAAAKQKAGTLTQVWKTRKGKSQRERDFSLKEKAGSLNSFGEPAAFVYFCVVNRNNH